MASFDDDADPTAGSQEEDENDDEEMEDTNDGDQDADQDMMDQGGDDDDDEDGDEDNDNDNDDDNDEDEDGDQGDPESPSRRASQHMLDRRSPERERNRNPALPLTSPSPQMATQRSPGGPGAFSFIPPVRHEALNARTYDIVPTMAAPQGTSINAIAATPDMRWVFSGGTDGYVRMYNWVETANGKVPLTVAQKHPFVDSVMKAGSLLTYWENEEHSVRTPPSQPDEGKWTSPVYALAVQHQALWLLSGLESGGINLQTCRHQAGTRITTLKEHTSAVSILNLSHDETSVLSGSWDKNIHDWDLNGGRIKRSFKGSSGQISAIETRPLSDVSVPEVVEAQPESLNGTFSSNNADKPFANGHLFSNIDRRGSRIGMGDDDALGSPEGSLFGEGDHGSLFGEDAGGGGGANTFGDDDDDLTRALESEMQDSNQNAAGDVDPDMSALNKGGPVQTPVLAPMDAPLENAVEPADAPETQSDNPTIDGEPIDHDKSSTTLTNGLPHSDEPLTAPPTNEDQRSGDLPPQSESTFLDAAMDGTLRVWDKRVAAPIALIPPQPGEGPWATGACWSPDGNFFYVGRRGCTVDEFSIHHLANKRSTPYRTLRFPSESGRVYALRAMPNRRHLLCASHDILRIYDLAQSETRHKTVPFNIVPGHRGGVISALHIDPSCRFMLSASGNRGWEGTCTEVLLGYEIGIQDDKGIWHK